MVSEATRIRIIDNSGVLEGKCIKVIWPKSGKGRRVGREGDLVVMTVTRVVSGSKIKRGDIVKGLIVRTKHKGRGIKTGQEKNRFVKVGKGGLLGQWEMYQENSGIIVKMGTAGAGGKIKNYRELTPIATRAKGPIGGKVRMNKNNGKVIAIVE